jgi:hypothetical protein
MATSAHRRAVTAARSPTMGLPLLMRAEVDAVGRGRPQPARREGRPVRTRGGGLWDSGGWACVSDEGSTTVVASALRGREVARTGELEAEDGGACGLLEAEAEGRVWRAQGGDRRSLRGA